MAGRLRTQLAKLNDLGYRVRLLADELLDSAPSGVFSVETGVKRCLGEPLDEKTELWNQAKLSLEECEDALSRLYDLLEQRVRKLPTYRPLVANSIPKRDTGENVVEIATDGVAEVGGAKVVLRTPPSSTERGQIALADE